LADRPALTGARKSRRWRDGVSLPDKGLLRGRGGFSLLKQPGFGNSPWDAVERIIRVMIPDSRLPLEAEMNTMTIELPVEGLPSPAELPNNFSDEVRYLLALKLFEQGRISSGKAGRLAGLGRVEFLLAASRDGVAVVDMTDEELAEEFAA
jgi:predicted HTH domain antitoxin